MDESLRVQRHIVSAHRIDVRIGKPSRHLAYRLGQEQTVGIRVEDDFAVCSCYASVQGTGLAGVGLVKIDDAPVLDDVVNALFGMIGRAVVDDDDFQIRIIAIEQGKQGRAECPFLVVGGNDDANPAFERAAVLPVYAVSRPRKAGSAGKISGSANRAGIRYSPKE